MKGWYDMETKVKEIWERLQFALEYRNISQNQLARETDINVSLINRYVKGVVVPKNDTIFILANALNVNPIWLMGFDVPIDDKNSDALKIPIYDFTNNEKSLVGHTFIGNSNSIFGRYSAMYAQSDNMAPVIQKDDLLIIKEQNDCSNDDIVVISERNKDAYVKRLKKYRDYIELYNENEKIPQRISAGEIKNRDLHIVGRVIETRKEL